MDTHDTLMEDAESVETYGKAVADALSTLQPDAQFLALYPFEVTLGEAGELPEGQKEFSVTFSDDEIVQAFQSGIKSAVTNYIIFLPVKEGVEYEADDSHVSEEYSTDKYTVLLYKPGDIVSFQVNSDSGSPFAIEEAEYRSSSRWRTARLRPRRVPLSRRKR